MGDAKLVRKQGGKVGDAEEETPVRRPRRSGRGEGEDDEEIWEYT